MNARLPTDPLEILADYRLLKYEQFEEVVSRLWPLCRDWKVLGMELVYRGWLTPFQLRYIEDRNVNGLFLGHYVLLDQLGEGAMGRVYKARNWEIDKIVAIKILRKEKANDPKLRHRFRREIEALGRISHPNIVMVYDTDADSRILYYSMEYIPGTDLSWHIRKEGPLPIDVACRYILQAASALQQVYEKGMVHRDIKPSNFLVAEQGECIKLLDLGLARIDQQEEDQGLTQVGSLVGTPDYIAPEQAIDSRRADIRSDLYSLGCTFYYLLTGVAPFDHVQPIEKLYFHCREAPRPLEELRPDVPPSVSAVVRKLMMKKPVKRFQTPLELMSTLAAIVEFGVLNVATDPNISQEVFEPLDIEHEIMSPTQIVSKSNMDLVLPPEPPQPTAANVQSLWLNPLQLSLSVVLAGIVLSILWVIRGAIVHQSDGHFSEVLKPLQQLHPQDHSYEEILPDDPIDESEEQ